MKTRIENNSNVHGFRIRAKALDIERFKENPVFVETAIKQPLNEVKIISEHFGLADDNINQKQLKK